MIIAGAPSFSPPPPNSNESQFSKGGKKKGEGVITLFCRTIKSLARLLLYYLICRHLNAIVGATFTSDVSKGVLILFISALIFRRNTPHSPHLLFMGHKAPGLKSGPLFCRRATRRIGSGVTRNWPQWN